MRWHLVLIGLGSAACGRVDFGAAVAGDVRADARSGADAVVDAPADADRSPDVGVQGSGGTVGGGSTSDSVAFAADVIAGHLLIAAFDYDFSGDVTATVADSAGNTWQVATGPTGKPGYAQYLAYALAATDGPLAVTSTLSGPCATAIELRIVEFATTKHLLDGTGHSISIMSNANDPVSTSVTTTAPDELLIGFDEGLTTSVMASGGYATDSSFDGNLVEHAAAPTPGTYMSSAIIAGPGGWIAQLASFQ